MQLKPHRAIRGLLTAATSTLLAGVVQQPAAAGEKTPWQVDSAFLVYSETDRVTILEPVVAVRKAVGDEEFIGVRLVLDSMSGASPNGAIPTDKPQTFSSPSGETSYTTPAGETPMDTTFRDARVALSADWETPLTNHLKATVGGNISSETDYASAGISVTLAQDLNKRNTTLSAGVSLSRDEISPMGGVPVGLGPVPAPGSESEGEDEGGLSKDIQEFLVGITQVMGPKTLLQLNYTYANEKGYLNDPYKLLSVLDTTGQLRTTDPYLYEKRPDSRQRQALYLKLVHQFGDDVLHAAFRSYQDDWGITSNTFDLHYRFEMAGGRHYLQPHYRFYDQSKADFYYYYLEDGKIPSYASADYRLGDMSTTTIGLKYGLVLGESHEFGARVESMTQKAEGTAPFDDNKAIILQLNYSFVF